MSQDIVYILQNCFTDILFL